TLSTSQSANKKQEFVKSDDKKDEKKADEKKRDMSKIKCYNCKKEGHFAKDCNKAKVKDYNYYKTKMLLAKKDSDEQNAPPTLKDPKFWTAEEKKSQKIDRLARSLLIKRLPNDIYSLIDSNKTAKDLWDALERQMRGSEYGEQDRKAVILYVYETFKAIEGE
nr:uncharacterized protein [Tanacetum cinerariifolium]